MLVRPILVIIIAHQITEKKVRDEVRRVLLCPCSVELVYCLHVSDLVKSI